MQMSVNRGIGRKGTIWGLTVTHFKMGAWLLMGSMFAYFVSGSILLLVILLPSGMALLKLLSLRFGEDGFNKFMAHAGLVKHLHSQTTLRQWLGQKK